MISFITLSRTPEKVETLRGSIHEMMGQDEWELVVIDGTKFDIFSGYNEGVRTSKYDFLIFVHDDVAFVCNGPWFIQWLSLLKRKETGFLGVAGSLELPADAIWWNGHSLTRGMVLHPSRFELGVTVNCWPGMLPGIPIASGNFGRVAVLDGVLLMATRETLVTVGGFNEADYSGFHFYDIDITYRATRAGLENFVVPMPIYHESYGLTGNAYDENRFKFLRKHGHELPLRLEPTQKAN